MIVEDHTLAIGQLLGGNVQFVRRRPLAVQRDMAVHDAVLVAVAKKLTAKQF